MDSNDWGTALGEVQMPGQVIDGEAVPAGGMEGGDWRTHLQQCSRQRIVDKIMETLKRHLPFSGQEGLQELKNIAIRFEEKIYSAATSQSDYLRKISLKMLTMETKSENPMANSLHSNAASNRKNPQDPVCPSMKLQMQNQVQQLPIPMVSNQSQVRQQILSQNIQNNIPSRGVPNSAGLNPAIPPVGGMSEETVPNVSVPNVNMQNMSNLNANAVGDSMGQGVPAHMYANSQRQILDRQQQVVSQVSRQKEPPVMHQQQSSMSQQLSAQQQQQLSAQQPSTANMQQNQMITQQKNMLDTQQIQQQQRIMAQQLQQQRIMQQQSNTLPGDTQQNIQSSGRMLQQKTTIDQQKELLRSSRVMPGVPLRFLDSSLQTGSATGGEWQEEIYQKIISMHKMYYPELNEMYQRMAAMLLQHDFYPQQPKNEQLEKLKFLKLMVERLIMFLRTNKNDIHPNHKEKIVGVEKQIVNFLNANRPREPVSLLQQGQLTQPRMHAMQQAQQQQPQVSQMHSNEGQMNTQMQPMNVQGSMMPTHQNYVTSLQHNTLSSSSSVSNSRQNMLDVLQLGSNIDPGQGSALYQLQSQRGMLQVPLNFTSKMGSATGGDTNQKRQQQYQQQLIHQQRLMLQQYMLRQPLMQKQQQQQPQQTSQQQSGRLPGELVMVITASVLLGVLVLIMLHCGELVHA